MNWTRIAMVGALLVGVTALHFLTARTDIPFHALYRELYFLPIVLSGLWGGRRFGLYASVASSILYLPHFILLPASPEFHVENVFDLFLFNVTGFLAGSYADAKRAYRITRSKPYRPGRSARRFLICLDDSPISLHAAQFFTEAFGRVPGISVTLFWVTPEKGPEYFESPEAAMEDGSEKSLLGKKITDHIRHVLMAGGVDQESITVKRVRSGAKSKISDRVLEEISEGEYDTVVIGKHHLTKPQEFLFGSVTIRLIREAPITVIAVKRPGEEGDDVEPGGQS